MQIGTRDESDERTCGREAVGHVVDVQPARTICATDTGSAAADDGIYAKEGKIFPDMWNANNDSSASALGIPTCMDQAGRGASRWEAGWRVLAFFATCRINGNVNERCDNTKPELGVNAAPSDTRYRLSCT